MVNIRCKQLFYWQHLSTSQLRGESSKKKQTSAGVKIPRSSLCAASASLFASPLLSLQHKAFVYKLCKPSLQQPCIPQASIFPSTSPCWCNMSTSLYHNNDKLSLFVFELVDFMKRLAVKRLDWRPVSIIFFVSLEVYKGVGRTTTPFLVCVAGMQCIWHRSHSWQPVSDCMLQRWLNVRENIHCFFWWGLSAITATRLLVHLLALDH